MTKRGSGRRGEWALARSALAERLKKMDSRVAPPLQLVWNAFAGTSKLESLFFSYNSAKMIEEQVIQEFSERETVLIRNERAILFGKSHDAQNFSIFL
jgi:hypothetical protein